MKRRDFLAVTGAGMALAAAPGQIWAAISGLTEDEVERRVKDTLARMTLSEKVELMAGQPRKLFLNLLTGKKRYTGYTASNEGLGIPEIRCLDGPRGVGLLYKTTCFPVSMSRGASWDPALEERVGEVMGYETRALGANMLLAPCINLLWHPRWGRAQETYGEDPYLLGVFGSAHVRGVQKHAMACPKHFAVNNVEDTRTEMSAEVDERTLRETFLPHFKACVEAGAASMMSAYNDLNGYLCAHNKHLLRDILKGDWGFDGFVVSDWGSAVEDTVEAGNAGLDLEMPVANNFGKKLEEAVLSGAVPEAHVDEAASRLLRQAFRFISDDNQAGYDEAEIACPKHAQVALEAARKGMVLLKNENNALPLDRGNIKKLALVGRLADKANLGDRGSSIVTPPYSISARAGIIERAGSVEVVCKDGRNMGAAQRAAREADAVVVIAGLDWKDEGEGHDRRGMGLSDDQVSLIRAMAAENKRCAVVVEGGSAITMREWVDEIPAVLMAWYPGMEGGRAIADVLFGDYNPCGRLPVVFPRSEDQLFKFENRAKKVEYRNHHGYRYFDLKGLEPEFHFGYGLSYTTFKHDNLRLSASRVGKGGRIDVKVDVANTGKMAGEEVVQVYVGYKGSKVERAKKDLKGFGRVALAPGEKKTVTVPLKIKDLAFYDVAESRWVVEEIEYMVYAGPSSRNRDSLTAGFRVSGA